MPESNILPSGQSRLTNGISEKTALWRILSRSLSPDIGGSVRSLARIMADAPADARSIIPIFIDVLNSLESIHRKDHLHVPLTPTAIRFSQQGRIEIRSFAASDTERTVGFGNAKYAAPDALRREIQQECAALDSYVVGFMFYELFLGNKLFREEFKHIPGDTDPAWLSWHTNAAEHARPIAEVISGFPASLSQIVAGMLEKDPAKRSTDLTRIAARLQNMIDATRVSTKSIQSHREERKPGAKLNRHSLQSINPAGSDVPSRARAFRGQHHARKLWNAGRSLLAAFAGYSCKARSLVIRIRQMAFRAGIESLGQISTKKARRSAVLLSIPALALLGVLTLLCHSPDRTWVTGSLPRVILTDTGEMVLVRAGDIALGAAHVRHGELHREMVYVPPFYMDRDEVSNLHYWEFLRATRRALPQSPPRRDGRLERPGDPALDVSWSDARAFAEWAGKWLPSELEWKAAKSALGHAHEARVFNAALRPPPVLTWADGNFLGSASESSPVIRIDDSTPVSKPLSEINGDEEIRFRCAASTHILETRHFLKTTAVSHPDALR